MHIIQIINNNVIKYRKIIIKKRSVYHKSLSTIKLLIIKLNHFTFNRKLDK